MDKDQPPYLYEGFEDDTPGPSPPQYAGSDINQDYDRKIVLQVNKTDSKAINISGEDEDCSRDDRDGEESKPRPEDEDCLEYDTDGEGGMSYHEDNAEDKALLIARTLSAGSSSSNEVPGHVDHNAGQDKQVSKRKIKLALPIKRKAKFAKQARKARKKASQLVRSGTNLCRQMSMAKPTIKSDENIPEECSKAVIPLTTNISLAADSFERYACLPSICKVP